jgi:hypothetical protein
MKRPLVRPKDLFVLAFAAFVVVGTVGNIFFPGPETPTVDPSATSPPADSSGIVKWTLAGFECADGWEPPSIYKDGACDGHGGVVEVWLGSDGTVLRCPDGGGLPPYLPEMQEQQLREYGRFRCI